MRLGPPARAHARKHERERETDPLSLWRGARDPAERTANSGAAPVHRVPVVPGAVRPSPGAVRPSCRALRRRAGRCGAAVRACRAGRCAPVVPGAVRPSCRALCARRAGRCAPVVRARCACDAACPAARRAVPWDDGDAHVAMGRGAGVGSDGGGEQGGLRQQGERPRDDGRQRRGRRGRRRHGRHGHRGQPLQHGRRGAGLRRRAGCGGGPHRRHRPEHAHADVRGDARREPRQRGLGRRPGRHRHGPDGRGELRRLHALGDHRRHGHRPGGVRHPDAEAHDHGQAERPAERGQPRQPGRGGADADDDQPAHVRRRGRRRRRRGLGPPSRTRGRWPRWGARPGTGRRRGSPSSTPTTRPSGPAGCWPRS